MKEVLVKRLKDEAQLPQRAHAGDAGYDLFSTEELPIVPGKWIKVNTGLQFQLPTGLEAQVRPRSGMALRYGVTVLNSPGTIDSSYRGEVSVILINHGDKVHFVKRGDRIAQVVFSSIPDVDLIEATAVNETVRGEGGFGSSGR